MTQTDLNLNDPVPGLPTFTDEQIKALTDYLVAAGKSRGREQRADFSEADYLAGCMATLFALGRQDKIPAGWIFEIMAGGSPLGLPDLDKDVWVVYDPFPRKEQERVTLYTNKATASEHVDFLYEHEHDSALLLCLPARHALHPTVLKALDDEDEAKAEAAAEAE